MVPLARRDAEWEEDGGRGYLGWVDLGVALEHVDDAIYDLLAGEVRVMGGHGPSEPARQGVRVGHGRGCRRGEGLGGSGGQADAAENRRTERRRRHFCCLLVRVGAWN